MDRLFFILLLVSGILLILLFFPIYLATNVYYDMNGRKCAFSIRAYDFIPIIGGYIATYKGGLALHVSEKKAILLPYKSMNKEREKFSVVQSFSLKTLIVTIETGADYLIASMWAQIFLRSFFLLKGGKKEKLSNHLWLVEGDVLRISMRCVLRFNGYILIKEFIHQIRKEGVLCQTKIKESTT
ncbi:MAG: hypothetical protein IJW96_02940 [Clostridia bacterium]|nr:hypothetical protein [Clostridia bacterium]